MTFRIEIFQESHRIDRSPMPAQLALVYSQSEWDHFCDQVDVPLKKFHIAKRNATKVKFAVWLLCILFAVAYILLLRPHVFLLLQGMGLYYESTLEGSNGRATWIDYVVGGVLIAIPSLVTYIKGACMVPAATSKAWKAVDSILVHESERKRVVSFHLKEDLTQEVSGSFDAYGGHIFTEKNYKPFIECNLAVNVPMGTDTNQHSIPVAVSLEEVDLTDTTETAKQHLADLEDAKEFLSEEKCVRKKVSILR